jgi:hypothetical protein
MFRTRAAGEPVFQSGWFIESLLSQTLIVHMIRREKVPFIQSRAAVPVLLLDENPDIMDEFLLNGKVRAIPVAVFYTRDHRYISHWTERPAVAHAEISRMRAEFSAAHPTVDLKAPTVEDWQTVKTFFDARLPQHYPAWQVETVREIRELLAAAPDLR